MNLNVKFINNLPQGDWVEYDLLTLTNETPYFTFFYGLKNIGIINPSP